MDHRPPHYSALEASALSAMMSSLKSGALSEATLLRRCEGAVEACKQELQDLRRVVKGARSHREKCAALLTAANTAVIELENVMYSEYLDVLRGRALQQLCARVQAALDSAEAIVKVYGSMGSLAKLRAKLFAPALEKFEEATTELHVLTRQAQTLLRGSAPDGLASLGSNSSLGLVGLGTSPPPPPPPVPPPGEAARPSTDGSGRPSMASQPAYSAASSLPAGSPPGGAYALGGGSGYIGGGGFASGSGLVVVGTPPSGTPSSTAAPAASDAFALAPAPSGAASETPGRRPSSIAEAALRGSAGLVGSLGRRTFKMRDQDTPMEALQTQRIFKGSRHQQVSAMLYVPPRPEQLGTMGSLWWFVSKTFSSGDLHVRDLSSGVDSKVKETKRLTDVTCMHLDETRGLVWTGHRNGTVQVWEEATQQPFCDALRPFARIVKALTLDERGHVWAGDEAGKVKALQLTDVARDGVVVEHKLEVRGQLKKADPGMPEGEEENGMLVNPYAKENCHQGTLTAIAAAVGRVWTSGGHQAFVCLREWSQRGEFIGSHDLRSMGSANAMAITSPLVRVRVPTVASAGAVGSVVSRGSLATAEVDQVFQLLTVHNCGMIQVWTQMQGRLQPLLRIGDRRAPAIGLVVCEQLGALCTAHNDGKLLLQSLPHYKSPSGLNVDFVLNKVAKVKLPACEQDVTQSGLALIDGGLVGVVAASNCASIKLWPEAELRRIAQGRGAKLLSVETPVEQWPVRLFKSAHLQTGPEGAPFADRESLSLLASRAAGRPGPGDAPPPAAPLFGGAGGATPWLIDFQDLTCSQVIGEGAFGKVFLGRWQETDVAIKMLGSLTAIGVTAGSVLHDESGTAKLDPDVAKQLDREVGLMVAMRHPNIILFMGVCVEPAAVVTEFCSRGSLYDLLKQACSSPTLAKQLDWPKRLSMALDSAKGMLYLHSHKPPIIHRDLKVTDFNLSRLSDAAGPALGSTSVTANNPRWQAPEVIVKQGYSKASDIYAFGLILWELMTWQLPFEEASPFQIMTDVAQKGERPPVPNVYEAGALPGGSFLLHDQWVALMQDCWAQQPEDRPTFEQVIARLRAMAEEFVALRTGASAGGASAVAAAAPPPLAAPPAEAPPQRRQQQQQQQASPFASAVGVSLGSASAASVPSPFDVPSAAASASAAAAVAAGGGGSLPSSAVPPPSPFGGGGSSLPSNGPPPPSPFGGGGGAPAQQHQQQQQQQVAMPSNASPVPFGNGIAAPRPVASNSPPSPSPFGGGPMVVASNASPVPSPFGGVAPPTYASNSPPPPSPFGGGGAGPSASPKPPPADLERLQSDSAEYLAAAAAPLGCPRDSGGLVDSVRESSGGHMGTARSRTSSGRTRS